MPPIVRNKSAAIKGNSGALIKSKTKKVTVVSSKQLKGGKSASEFVSRTEAILERLDEDRLLNPLTEDSDNTYEFYRAALAETLEMIPIAKANFMRYSTQSNAYTYNSLVTKSQELLADLEALADKGQMIDKIINQLVLPSFMGLTATLGNSFVSTQADVKALCLPPEQEKQVLKLIAQMVRTTGAYLQDSSNSLTSQIRVQFDDN